MDDAALAAAHRVEMKWRAGSLYTLRGGGSAQSQLLDSQDPEIVGVEAQQRVIFSGDAENLHRQVLQCKQHLSAIFEENIDVRPAESNHHIGVFEIGMSVRPFGHLKLQLEPRRADQGL